MTSFDKKSHSHAPLQLCIFDDRRGEKEGQEADKILGFYPSNTPPDSQAALVGLTQAALAFTSTFQPVSFARRMDFPMPPTQCAFQSMNNRKTSNTAKGTCALSALGNYISRFKILAMHSWCHAGLSLQCLEYRAQAMDPAPLRASHLYPYGRLWPSCGVFESSKVGKEVSDALCIDTATSMDILLLTSIISTSCNEIFTLLHAFNEWHGKLRKAIFLVQVVEREWHRGFVRESGLKTLLIQLHQLLTLIHGLIGCLLQKVQMLRLIDCAFFSSSASAHSIWLMSASLYAAIFVKVRKAAANDVRVRDRFAAPRRLAFVWKCCTLNDEQLIARMHQEELQEKLCKRSWERLEHVWTNSVGLNFLVCTILCQHLMLCHFFIYPTNFTSVSCYFSSYAQQASAF